MKHTLTAILFCILAIRIHAQHITSFLVLTTSGNCSKNPVATKPAAAKPVPTQTKLLKFQDLIYSKDIISLKENSSLLLLSNDDREILVTGPVKLPFDSLVLRTLRSTINPGSGKVFYFVHKYGGNSQTPTYPFNTLQAMRCPPDPFHPLFPILKIYGDTLVYAHKFTTTSTGEHCKHELKKVVLLNFTDDTLTKFFIQHFYGRNPVAIRTDLTILKIVVKPDDKCSQSSDLLIQKLNVQERDVLENDFPSFHSKSDLVKAFYFEMNRLYSDAAFFFEKAAKNNTSNREVFNLFLTRNRFTDQFSTYKELEMEEAVSPSPLQ